MLYFSGELILVEHIQLRVISLVPLMFSLRCFTSGGPLASTYWTINSNIIVNNETFNTSLVVVDYIDAVYNHTIVVKGNFPGTYKFFAQDPFILDESKFVTLDVNPEGVWS